MGGTCLHQDKTINKKLSESDYGITNGESIFNYLVNQGKPRSREIQYFLSF